MAIIESKLKEVPDYFIFSDEPVTYYFKNLSNFHFVNINDAHHGYCDLELMKHCEHHIIANSSFSWWGAWLGYNPDRLVIAPKLWFNSDQHRIQIPEKWIRI
jgi:hypothetical protein